MLSILYWAIYIGVCGKKNIMQTISGLMHETAKIYYHKLHAIPFIKKLNVNLLVASKSMETCCEEKIQTIITLKTIASTSKKYMILNDVIH